MALTPFGVSTVATAAFIRRFFDIARDTGDDVVYAYAMLIANDPNNWDQHLCDMVRALAENRKYLLEQSHQRLLHHPAMVVWTDGQLHIDAIPIRDFIQSLRRRLTRRLRKWYASKK